MKIYEKVRLPLMFLLGVTFIATLFMPKQYTVTCWDNSTLELDEFREDWESFCPPVPDPRSPVFTNVSMYSGTEWRAGNPIRHNVSLRLTNYTFN